jgi:serine-type D-Ala-D-Ala carboxypeptidase
MPIKVDLRPTGISPSAFGKACAFIEAELAAKTFPGAVLRVMQHGKVLLDRHWGTYCSRTRRDVPYDGATINRLFSFSKGIASTVAVMTHQDGLLDYDAPVRAYIPAFTGGGKDAITVRHLLTHSMGMPTPPFGATYTTKQWNDAVAAMCKAPVEWEPGSRTAYHAATSFVMLAEIIRRVTDGASWDEICRRRLFAPLGATSLTYVIPGDDAPVAMTGRPKELPCKLDPEKDGILGHPGGGCFGTVADAMKVVQLHLDGGVWRGQRLIEPSALKEMHTSQFAREIKAAEKRGVEPPHEAWGLGWALKGTRSTGTSRWFGFGANASVRSFGHAGIDAVMLIGDPERDLAIAFLTTDSPEPSGDNTIRIRSTVTDLVVEAIDANEKPGAKGRGARGEGRGKDTRGGKQRAASRKPSRKPKAKGR